MNSENLFLKIVKILKKLKIAYFVTGGFAVAVLAKPRFTADIDIVIKLPEEKISEIIKHLKLTGKNVYVPDEEVIRETVKQTGEFNFIHPQTGLKVDFWIKRYPFEKFENVVVKKIDGQKVNFISPENLILSKLIWYKEGQGAKQLEDIKSLLEIAKPNLNYIKNWAKKQSILKILEEIMKDYNPPTALQGKNI